MKRVKLLINFIPKYGDIFWYEYKGFIFWERYYNVDVQNEYLRTAKCYRTREEAIINMKAV